MCMHANHDVAITNVVPDRNETYPTCETFNVTVENNGTVTTNCTVNAYYHNSSTWLQINTPQNVTNLAPSNSVNVTFTWDLWTLWNNWQIDDNATYTLKANATCACLASDEYIYAK